MPTPSVYAKQVARIQELELTEERQEEEIQDLTSQLETCARERNDALEACIRLNSELDAARREQREANARSDAPFQAEPPPLGDQTKPTADEIAASNAAEPGSQG